MNKNFKNICFIKKGHAIIEMPTGTGKTVSILSLISSYIITYPEKYGKLIYCTRTVAEMEKTLKELKFIEDSRKKAGLPHSNVIYLYFIIFHDF